MSSYEGFIGFTLKFSFFLVNYCIFFSSEISIWFICNDSYLFVNGLILFVHYFLGFMLFVFVFLELTQHFVAVMESSWQGSEICLFEGSFLRSFVLFL